MQWLVWRWSGPSSPNTSLDPLNGQKMTKQLTLNADIKEVLSGSTRSCPGLVSNSRPGEWFRPQMPLG